MSNVLLDGWVALSESALALAAGLPTELWAMVVASIVLALLVGGVVAASAGGAGGPRLALTAWREPEMQALAAEIAAILSTEAPAPESRGAGSLTSNEGEV